MAAVWLIEWHDMSHLREPNCPAGVGSQAGPREKRECQTGPSRISHTPARKGSGGGDKWKEKVGHLRPGKGGSHTPSRVRKGSPSFSNDDVPSDLGIWTLDNAHHHTAYSKTSWTLSPWDPPPLSKRSHLEACHRAGIIKKLT